MAPPSMEISLQVLTKNMVTLRVYQRVKINLSNRMQILKGRNVFFHYTICDKEQRPERKLSSKDCPLCFLCILKYSQEFLWPHFILWFFHWVLSNQSRTYCSAQDQRAIPSVQFSSVAQSCPTLCDPLVVNKSKPFLIDWVGNRRARIMPGEKLSPC